ncbi:MFS transporter [Brachyspira pilosicoli]|uniref:Probable transporter n=2 Tax=Brachyspira pilosicoli TaxID=52584 RepID=D8IC10_BRAP9|nr:MFS transporter [Brachyspira pilosicoli]ADK30683.1 probable transporter [Brachyspira pilosicoli 95/1000]AGA67493.1 putative transporter [Brachyspira pilosicoli P43/6/78]MBW5378688.1 MFS transporter [Brachyspira pilosicoli]MBW5383604.1 MFS transporter [Brachyspira pilosicoli]
MPNTLFIIMILYWFSLYTYIPFQVPYLYALNVTPSIVGIILGLYGASQMILRFPFGIISDYFGKYKIFIVLGSLLSAVSCIIKIVYPSANGFLVGNILTGVAASTWLMYMVLYYSYFDRSKEHMAASKCLVANVIGMFLGFLFATIFYQKFGMNLMLIAAAFAAFAATILALFLKEEKREKKNNIKDLILVIKNKRLLFFSVLSIIEQGIHMAASVSFTLNRIKELGGASYLVGIASLLNMFFAIVSAYIASTSFASKRGSKFYVPFSFVLLGLYCVAVILTKNIFVIVASQILSGLSIGMLASYLTSEALIEIDRDKKSSAMGFYQTAYSIGIFIYPIITGKIVEMYSIEMAYIFLTASAVICAFIALLYYKKVKA